MIHYFKKLAGHLHDKGKGRFKDLEKLAKPIKKPFVIPTV